MGYMGDVKTKTFIDDNASSATYVAAAAQPTSTFTLAATSFGTNTGRKITATTSGSSDGSKTVTIVGTDVNGDALTEVITLPGSATTTAGTTAFFLTITSATVSAQPAANVSLGMTADVAGGVFAGRTRVRQANVGSGGAIGNVDFRKELFVEPFKMDNSGLIKGLIFKGENPIEVDLHFEKYDDYMLVYTLNT